MVALVAEGMTATGFKDEEGTQIPQVDRVMVAQVTEGTTATSLVVYAMEGGSS